MKSEDRPRKRFVRINGILVSESLHYHLGRVANRKVENPPPWHASEEAEMVREIPGGRRAESEEH